MPTECQDGDWTIGNWALDLVANAFPFIYVNYLADYVAPGVIDSDTAYQISLEDATSFVNGFTGDGGLASGARVMAGNLQGGGRALPSDFLSDDVSYIIGASYLASAEGMAQLADLNARELVRVRSEIGDVSGPPPSSPVGRKGNQINVVGGNQATVINGRTYSGHALDRMQENGLVPSVIENTISHGVSSPGRYPNTTSYYDPVNNMRVIINSSNGTVITTGYGSP